MLAHHLSVFVPLTNPTMSEIILADHRKRIVAIFCSEGENGTKYTIVTKTPIDQLMTELFENSSTWIELYGLDQFNDDVIVRIKRATVHGVMIQNQPAGLSTVHPQGVTQ